MQSRVFLHETTHVYRFLVLGKLIALAHYTPDDPLENILQMELANSD